MHFPTQGGHERGAHLAQAPLTLTAALSLRVYVEMILVPVLQPEHELAHLRVVPLLPYH